MKSLLIILSLLLAASFSHAQDTVIKKNGDELSVKLIEINPDYIKYKKLDNMDGPVITVNKSDVFMIKYQNGSKEVMKTDADKKSRISKPGRLGICVDFGVSTGNDVDVYSTSIGGALRGEINVGSVLDFTVSAGYQHYITKHQSMGSYGSEDLSMYSILILLGLKFYGKEVQNGFYGLMQAGITSLNEKVTVTYNYYNYYPYYYYGTTSQTTSDATTITTFNPSIGLN